MQKVNLLPADLAPTGLSSELIRVIRKTALALGCLLALFLLIFFLARFELIRKNNILSAVMEKVKESDLLAENMEDLRKRRSGLVQELRDLDVYLSGGLIWSKKLRQLSAVMPEEVSLSRISFVRNDTGTAGKELLNIKGGLLPLADTPPINTLSSFINKLKQNKDFFPDFVDLLVTEIKKVEKSKVDVIVHKDLNDFLANKVTKIEKFNVDVMAFEISLVIKK